MQNPDKTVLARPFVFWFSFFKQSLAWKQPGASNVSTGLKYEENINKICTFNTVEDFWGYYQHMVRPEQLPIGCDFFLFQQDIKPMWEDIANKQGGRFILKIKKQYGNRFWEDLILSFIGEQFEKNDEICGINASVREKEIVLSIWVKKGLDSEENKERAKKWIRGTLGLSEKIEIEYREHPTEEKKIVNKPGMGKKMD